MKGLIFTYLLCYGGALTSLFNPYAGLLVYICFSIIKPEALWYWSVPQGNYSRIIAIALLVGWVRRGFGNWQFGRARAVVAFLLAYLIWSVLTSLLAAQPELSLTWVEALIKVVIPFLVGMTLIDSVEKLRQLAWVIALSQGYVAFEFNVSYYGGFNRIQEVGFAGMDNNSVAIALVTCIGLAFFLGFEAPRWWLKGIAFATVALMVHSVLFSFSRGGMLGLIITAGISFVLIPKKPRHYLIFVLMIVLSLRLAGPEVVKRFESSFADEKTRDVSSQSRIELWKACVEVMSQSPIIGIGPFHFPLIAHRYGFPRGKEAHTLWLTVGAEEGVIGLLFLLSFYGVCILRLCPLMRQSQPVADPWLRDTARMVIASLTGFAVSAQFVSLVGLETPYYVVLLGAGALKLSSMPQAHAAVSRAMWMQTPAFAPAGWQNIGR